MEIYEENKPDLQCSRCKKFYKNENICLHPIRDAVTERVTGHKRFCISCYNMVVVTEKSTKGIPEQDLDLLR